MQFAYTANGQKLKTEYQKLINGNWENVYTHYYLAGGLEIRNDDIEALNHPDGRIVKTAAPLTPTSFSYQYRIADHLGNTRVLFDGGDHTGTPDADDILQENHYYPFGLEQQGAWQASATPENRYRYNGKELNEELGLYAYGYRYYDPIVGRFTGVDPISDKFPHVSTYNYAENSPISNIDLHGLQAVFFQFGARVGAGPASAQGIGLTVSTSTGVAIDPNLNILFYQSNSLGAGVGAYAGGGLEGGLLAGNNGVDDLLGYTLSGGYLQSLEYLPGPQLGFEINFALSAGDTDGLRDFLMQDRSDVSISAVGFTAAPPVTGIGFGFLGYADLTSTKELGRITADDITGPVKKLWNELLGLIESGENEDPNREGDPSSRSGESIIMEIIRLLEADKKED